MLLPPQLPLCLPAGESSGSVSKRNWLLVKHYWHRVGGAALAWFVWVSALRFQLW